MPGRVTYYGMFFDIRPVVRQAIPGVPSGWVSLLHLCQDAFRHLRRCLSAAFNAASCSAFTTDLRYSGKIRIPSAQMFAAAFQSRSIVIPQCGHWYVLVFKSKTSSTLPHWQQVFEDGCHRSIFTRQEPFLLSL